MLATMTSLTVCSAPRQAAQAPAEPQVDSAALSISYKLYVAWWAAEHGSHLLVQDFLESPFPAA